MSTDSSGPMRFLPIGIDVRGKVCLVVGGGDVGTRKAVALVQAGAAVTVVSPVVTAELAEQIQAGRIGWVEGQFRDGHLSGVFLAVAATDDDALNAMIVSLAEERGALVCDASSAERSQVIFGALLESDDTTIAVFTDGRNPAQARRTRDQIARFIAAERKAEPQS